MLCWWYQLVIYEYIRDAFEPYQKSKMERFAKLVKDIEPLIAFTKRSMLDVWHGPEYASVYINIISFIKH